VLEPDARLAVAVGQAHADLADAVLDVDLVGKDEAGAGVDEQAAGEVARLAVPAERLQAEGRGERRHVGGVGQRRVLGAERGGVGRGAHGDAKRLRPLRSLDATYDAGGGEEEQEDRRAHQLPPPWSPPVRSSSPVTWPWSLDKTSCWRM